MMTTQPQRVDRWEYILDKCRGKKVLNIGCLAADKMSELHQRIKDVASEVYGLDIYESNLDNYIKGDAQDFDIGIKFDVIVSGEVIEHIWNIKGFFDSCINHLGDGGVLIVTTPNAYSPIFLKNAIMGQIVPNDKYHILMFDITTLSNLILNNLSQKFIFKMLYYYEGNATSGLYRLVNMISRLRRGYSVGIIAELQKK